MRVGLVACFEWKCVHAAMSGDKDIPEVPQYHLFWQISSQQRSQKIAKRIDSHELTAHLFERCLFFDPRKWTFSKACKPGSFESQNSLKLDFTNVWGLCSNLICRESFLEYSLLLFLISWSNELAERTPFHGKGLSGNLRTNLKFKECIRATKAITKEIFAGFSEDDLWIDSAYFDFIHTYKLGANMHLLFYKFTSLRLGDDSHGKWF